MGLVVYAGDAFTVAPITDDPANVAVFLDALAPDVMPVDGQRADRAIAWSAKLLRQAGFHQGEILVMGDHATAADIAAASTAASSGARISVLGVGGAETGGLDESSLRQLANAGRGSYQRITLDDADLRALGVLSLRAGEAQDSTGANHSGRQWLDEGFWLVPLVMLLVLPAFRRGAGIALLALVVAWPIGTVQAADWWRRPDQARHAAMEAAAQQYRRGEFEAAARGFAQADTADANYNRGNALARAGRYEDAIRAYDRALQRAPGMRDAEANRRAVQAALQRRPSPGGNTGAQGPQGRGNNPTSASRPSGAGQQSAGQSDPAQSRSPAAGARGKPSQASDAAAQAKADAAQRERMQRALAQGRGIAGDRQAQTAERPDRAETPAQRERRIANEAWLRRVPDDPGGLLRERFRLEYQRRQQQGATPP